MYLSQWCSWLLLFLLAAAHVCRWREVRAFRTGAQEVLQPQYPCSLSRVRRDSALIHGMAQEVVCELRGNALDHVDLIENMIRNGLVATSIHALTAKGCGLESRRSGMQTAITDLVNFPRRAGRASGWDDRSRFDRSTGAEGLATVRHGRRIMPLGSLGPGLWLGPSCEET